jgi:solute carrier organic anion transporter family protein 1C
MFIKHQAGWISSHRTIIVLLCSAAFIHNVVMNGAMNVILSSLQKEFYLSSKDTGIYISVYDIGSLISSIFVPVMGARGSKPRWIAFGMCMLCLGCFINVTPHFLKPRSFQMPFNDTAVIDLNDDHGVNRFELCHESDMNNANSTNTVNSCTSKLIENQGSSFRVYNLKYVFYMANIVNGFSSSSMTTLAFSYIEDIAPHELATIYESVYYATGALGMGVGFMLTSQFLSINTDFDSLKTIPVWLKPNHPNWIGAWWLPFIIFGIIAAIFAALISLLPKRLNHDRTNHAEKSKIFKESKAIGTENGKANGTVPANEEIRDSLTDSEEKENSAADSDDHVKYSVQRECPFLLFKKTIPQMT